MVALEAEPISAAAVASPAPAPARKKKSTKKSKKKKATIEGEEENFDGERWLDEQAKLTRKMNKLYSGEADSDEDSSEPDEDHLTYYDYAAEEKALAARVAELKRVSSLESAAGPSSSDADAQRPVRRPPRAQQAGGRNDEAVDVSDAPPMTPRQQARAAETARRATNRANAAAAAKAFTSQRSQRTARTARGGEAPSELEPFGIGRQANESSFPAIEVTLTSPKAAPADSAAASDAAAAGDASAPASEGAAASKAAAVEPMPLPIKAAAAAAADAAAASGEPPLTPRSLASSIAARRQANQKLRSDGLASPRASTKISSPTGA